MGCMMGACYRCWGAMKVVAGLLVLANFYLLKLDWALFIGGLLVLGGLVKIAMPNCGHCMPEEKAPSKKRR